MLQWVAEQHWLGMLVFSDINNMRVTDATNLPT